MRSEAEVRHEVTAIVRRRVKSGSEASFESLMQEQTIALAPGDLVVWFTDGISETMNEAFDCFGEERLAQVVRKMGKTQ